MANARVTMIASSWLVAWEFGADRNSSSILRIGTLSLGSGIY